MKANYAVLRLYKTFEPSLLETFENEKDAMDYARILNNKGEYQHVVFKAVEG